MKMTSKTFTASLIISSCIFISVLCNEPAPIIKSLHIVSDIKYTYAKTLVTSRILNPANVSQEVNFRVILPEEAFITGFVMTIKGKSYEAYIEEKEKAKKDYDAAVSAGQSAGHIFQTNSRYSKDFTVSVNVEAEDKVKFNLTFEELLSRKNRTYKNEININPHQIVSDLSIVVNIEDLLDITNVVVPKFQMSNEIDQSETENPNIKKQLISSKKVRVEWVPTETEQKELNADGLNGKMIVKYDVDASKNPQQILVDEDGYFVHILRNDDLPVLKKHVVFVLDVSGSMYGNKIEQLKQAMAKILSDLSENDYFSIVLFSVKLLPWKTEGVDLESLNSYDEGLEPASVPVKDYYIVPANKTNVDLALKFIKELSTYGGTNINGGLRVGIGIAKLGQMKFKTETSPVEPMIIFLTDGEPNVEESDPDKITQNVDKLNTGKVTIFSLGFGFDADMNFLKKLSLANNGFARRIYADSDAALQLNNFYKEVASPVLSDVSFEYLPDQVQNTTAETKNLYSGSEIIILGKVKPKGTVSGVLSVTTPEGRKKLPFPTDIIILPPREHNNTVGHLQKMWAYKTIKSLLDQNTVSKNDTVEEKAKLLALKYKFVTPLTSLVVVKPNVSSVVNDQLEGLPGAHGPAYVRTSSSYGRSTLLQGISYMKTSLNLARGGAHSYGGGLAYPMGSPALSVGGLLPQSFAVPAPPLIAMGSPVQNNRFSIALSADIAGRPSGDSSGGLIFDTKMDIAGWGATNYGEILTEPEMTGPPNLTTTIQPLLQTTMKNVSYNKVPYTSVSWLNQTVSEDGLFLQPPREVDLNDLIALNETDVSKTKCSDGNDCRHFIYCALDVFLQDIESYLPFKCHIDPKFLGVCCPV